MSSAVANLRPTDFASAMQALPPRGDALPRDPSALFAKLMTAMSGRMAAVHAHAALLSEVESDPRQATLLLPDWEKSLGLPDPCLGPAPNIGERRSQVVARLSGRGGVRNDAFYISYAASLGYAITIQKFQPFNFGDDFGLPLNGIAFAFAWQVSAPSITYEYFEFGSNSFGDPFAVYDNTVLQCELQRISPAHTRLIFKYGSSGGDFSPQLDFSVGANSAYVAAL